MVLMLVVAAGWSGAAGLAGQGTEGAVKITKMDGKVRVELDGKLFTEFLHQGHSRPVLYPVIGPTGKGVTRNWPIVKGDATEATDHPHHKSIWYTHGDVNGVDFWSETKGAGTVVVDKVETGSDAKAAWIQSSAKWLDKDGNTVCTDTTVIRFPQGVKGGRIIDFQITIHASAGKLTMGDTKEGTMAIRTHPGLRLTAKDKKPGPGHAVNSEGLKDHTLWGKKAKWVDYWGPIDGKTVGIALMDHPSNPRHPTTWHARDYGLVAANPFGVAHFSGAKDKKAGDLVIEAGKSQTFKYRFYFHEGDAQQAKISEQFDTYAGEK